MSDSFRIVPAGDSAVIAEFDARIDPVINARAIALADALQRANLPGVRDIVPTYRSVAVYFDPLRTDYDALLQLLQTGAEAKGNATGADRDVIRIPVCYGGEFGPDLEEVAAFAKASAGDVVAIHAAATYRVFMVGFVAGFAYLGTVSE